MIELWCGNLSARCVWLYVIIMSRTSFRVNPHPIVCLGTPYSKQAVYLKFK